MKHNPPNGVTGPAQPTGNGNRCRQASRYSEPEKQAMPAVNNQALQFSGLSGAPRRSIIKPTPNSARVCTN